MFKAFKENTRQHIAWKPSGVEFLEGSFLADDTSNFTHGHLAENAIADWVAVRPHSTLSTSSSGQPRSTIRVLLCELASVHPTVLPLSSETYDIIEEKWLLPASALSMVDVHAGTYAEHIIRSPPERPKIRWVFKTPQKYEITNGTLILCHDFATKTTNAVWFYSSAWRSKISSWHRVMEQTRDNSQLWCNPMFLPCVMLTDHIIAIQERVTGDLTTQIIFVESQLNVTKVGRKRNYGGPGPRRGITMSKSKAEMLIVIINNLSTTVHFTSRSPKWHQDACEHLLKVQERLPSSPYITDNGNDELCDLLNHNLLRARSLSSQTESHRERLQLQLGILYTMLSQTDNALNARIAVSAGRDSTSMKILALITAAFLPGTFVATLFSMTMFQWQPDAASSADGHVVSDKFWVYWATAVPLTIVTLCGWGFWWSFEKRKYEAELFNAQEPIVLTEDLDRILQGT